MDAIEKKDGLILLAEDNELNREVINMQLSTLGYSVVAAADGKEALDLWKEGGFDLILTDCHMPHMDGFELARTKKSGRPNCPASHIPIIAVTANTVSEERDRCIDSGMDDCLTKPIDMDGLNEAVHKWLSVPES